MRLLALALASCCALCCRARAQDDAPFGTPGQWQLNGSVGVSGRLEAWKQPSNARPTLLGIDELHVRCSPSVRFFVAEDLEIGGYLQLGLDRYWRQDGVEFSSNGIGGGGLIGYRVGLGQSTFLLPELALGASYFDRSVDTGNTGILGRGTGLNYLLFLEATRTQASWSSGAVLHAGLFIPFAAVLAPRFYIGVGPYARLEYARESATPRGDDWAIDIGISTVVGTWL